MHRGALNALGRYDLETAKVLFPRRPRQRHIPNFRGLLIPVAPLVTLTFDQASFRFRFFTITDYIHRLRSSPNAH